jgi:hypothetical protein
LEVLFEIFNIYFPRLRLVSPNFGFTNCHLFDQHFYFKNSSSILF